jgi:hypothetical protein
MVRDDVSIRTTGNAPQPGIVRRYSRIGIGGHPILPSAPVSIRVRSGRTEMVATPRGKDDLAHRRVRQSMTGAETPERPKGRADRTLWYTRGGSR